MDELVAELSSKKHKVVAERAETAADLRESIDRGYVLVRFTETRGGTVLGLRLDMARTDVGSADFSQAQGVVRLTGTLVLNYNQVEVNAEIDLGTLAGEGSMTLIADEAQWRAQKERDAATPSSVH